MQNILNPTNLESQGLCVKEDTLFGEKVYLVNPMLSGTLWTKDSLIFRSSVWDKDYNLISAGFPKFFNYGESPDLYPSLPDTLQGVSLIEKIDGSLVIATRFNGQVWFRTRGSLGIDQQPNVQEFYALRDKYLDPLLSEIDEESSFLFEWASLTNKIILDHPEPDLYLVGRVYHQDYSLETQVNLDHVARTFGLKRPRRYTFDNLFHMMETVKAFKGIEGVCAYYSEDQTIVKVKGEDYCKRHAFKFHFSLNALTTMYFESGTPSRTTIEETIKDSFDFECLEMAKPILDRLYSAVTYIQSVQNRVESMKGHLESVDRATAARIFKQEYSGSDLSIAFMVLDGKNPISERLVRNILKEKQS